MFDFWYKDFPEYSPSHREFWRVKFIYHCLLTTTSLFFILAAINVFYFNDFIYGLLDSVGFALSLAAYVAFRRSKNIKVAAALLSIIVTALITIFVCLVKGYAHSIIWATLIPPFTFFLTGRKWGAIYTVFGFTICAYVVYQQTQIEVARPFSFGSFLNVLEVFIAHILLFRFYEKSRSAAYEELAKQKQHSETLADTDWLTGLFNRSWFDRQLNQAASQHTESFSIMLIDVDHFKQINDTQGHLTGDNVLKSLASRLQKCLPNNAKLARWGGEEFVVLLSATALDEAKEYAEKLRQAVSETLINNIKVTISVGVTEGTGIENIEAIIHLADKALYQAKDEGRNRSVALR